MPYQSRWNGVGFMIEPSSPRTYSHAKYAGCERARTRRSALFGSFPEESLESPLRKSARVGVDVELEREIVLDRLAIFTRHFELDRRSIKTVHAALHRNDGQRELHAVLRFALGERTNCDVPSGGSEVGQQLGVLHRDRRGGLYL